MKTEEDALKKIMMNYENHIIQLRNEAKLYGATDHEISNCSRNIECLKNLLIRKKKNLEMEEWIKGIKGNNNYY